MDKRQIELIPAIDLMDGKIVRLTQGKYSTKKTYSNAPLDFALQIEDLGFTRLHVVDLDGAKSQRIINGDVLENIANHTELAIDFGGGVKSESYVKEAFDCGAKFVTLGSLAATNPELSIDIIKKFGADNIIIGADVLNGEIRINGWTENSNLELFKFLETYTTQGINKVLCTDINKDGMLQGPSINLYKEIMKVHPHCHLIASGGVASLLDIAELDEAGIPAVVFGKAIYENKIDLKELARWAGFID